MIAITKSTKIPKKLTDAGVRETNQLIQLFENLLVLSQRLLMVIKKGKKPLIE